MKKFDLIVIGGGPGGYVASIRASQLGLSVACIDKNLNYGGTCLNVGCIPSKSLLHSSHMYEIMTSKASSYGIDIKGEISINLTEMMGSKNKTVSDLTSGVSHLIKFLKPWL